MVCRYAIYSVSDPRAEVFKGFVKSLAKEKGRMKEYELYSMIERMAPEVIAEERKIYKGVSANVDFYSGFVYSMLDLPLELFTPCLPWRVSWAGVRIVWKSLSIQTRSSVRHTKMFWSRQFMCRLMSVKTGGK